MLLLSFFHLSWNHRNPTGQSHNCHMEKSIVSFVSRILFLQPLEYLQRMMRASYGRESFLSKSSAFLTCTGTISQISQTEFPALMESLKNMDPLDGTFPMTSLTRLCYFEATTIIKSFRYIGSNSSSWGYMVRLPFQRNIKQRDMQWVDDKRSGV